MQAGRREDRDTCSCPRTIDARDRQKTVKMHSTKHNYNIHGISYSGEPKRKCKGRSTGNPGVTGRVQTSPWPWSNLQRKAGRSETI